MIKPQAQMSISTSSKLNQFFLGPFPEIFQLICSFDFRYKKNIKALYIVHPTMFIKTLLILFKPIIRYVPFSNPTGELYMQT